jgi:hypothetical protein
VTVNAILHVLVIVLVIGHVHVTSQLPSIVSKGTLMTRMNVYVGICAES